MIAHKILIVEDNITQQRLFAALSRNADLDAHIVASGQEAIDELMRSRDYLAVFMDLGLIGMDGLECTRRIRDLEIGTNKRMPIIAITARTGPEAIQECMDAGMDDYLSKPFTLEQMLGRLCSWLDKQDSILQP